MNDEGPQLEMLLHRLAECPAEFLQVSADADSVNVPAIACDLIRSMSPIDPPEMESSKLNSVRTAKLPEQSLISVVCWLLADEWFRSRSDVVPAIWSLFASPPLGQLARMVKAEKFVSDPDRREELVRFCLHQLGIRPRGETALQAADRLSSLDTIERERVLRATAAAERRAREVREAMAAKQAQESASRYGE